MIAKSVGIAVSAIAAILGLWCAAPSRNVVGSPYFETLISSCTLVESGAVARLYEGNGGATTAFWYTATLDPAGWYPERQIYYSYRGGPDSLECDSDGLHLALGHRSILMTEDALSMAYRGEVYPYSRDDPELLQLAHGQTNRRWVAGAIAASGIFVLSHLLRSVLGSRAA